MDVAHLTLWLPILVSTMLRPMEFPQPGILLPTPLTT